MVASISWHDTQVQPEVMGPTENEVFEFELSDLVGKVASTVKEDTLTGIADGQPLSEQKA